MIKRTSTPLNSNRYSSKSNSNANKPLKDTKNIQSKPSLSRNSSNSKLLVGVGNTEPVRWNPESADRNKQHAKVINDEMRKVVVEWMLEVSHRSKMRRQTIFIAVKLFDNGLDNFKDITVSNVQLLAIASLFMSAKYEEIYPESLHKFLDYTLQSYQKKDMLEMEEKILSLMGFRLTFDTRYTHGFMVVEKELSYGTNAKKLKSLIVFLLELSLYSHWDEYTENQMGQAGVFLAAKVLKYPPPQVTDRVMEAAFKLLELWRENEGGVLAYLFDSESECYVGGLKVVY